MNFIEATRDDLTRMRILVSEITAAAPNLCKNKRAEPKSPEANQPIPCLTLLLGNHWNVNLIEMTMDDLFLAMRSANPAIRVYTAIDGVVRVV